MPPGSLTIASGVSRPSSRLDRFLELVVAALDAGRRSRDAAQLELAPLAADVRRAQRARQPAGLGLQHLLRLGERAQLFAELRLGRDAALLDFLQLASRRASAIRAAAGRWLRAPCAGRRGRCVAACWNSPSEVRASWRKDSLLRLRASDESAAKASRRRASVAFEQRDLLGGRGRAASSCAPTRAHSCRAATRSCWSRVEVASRCASAPTARRRAGPGGRPRRSPRRRPRCSRPTSPRHRSTMSRRCTTFARSSLRRRTWSDRGR